MSDSCCVWRAFPVNIQTTLIHNTSITFLCHIFHFLSVSFYFASIFFIFLPINLYMRVLAHVVYFVLFISYAFHMFYIFITYFIFWFRVGFYFLSNWYATRDHLTAMHFPFRHFVSRSHGGRTVYSLSCSRGCLRNFK